MGLLLLGCSWVAFGCKPRHVPVTTAEDYFFRMPVTLRLAPANSEQLQTAATLAVLELRRLEAMFNPLNINGPLYRLNEAVTNPRIVSDPELYALLERAYQIMELTGSSLNLFLGYLEHAYGFERLFPSPPDMGIIQEILLSSRRASIEFMPERNQVQMPRDAYAISLTGIREGYAADQVLVHLAMAGITDALVAVGTRVACGGSPDGLGWPVAVQDPESGEVVLQLFVENCGVATVSITDQAYTYRDDTYYNHLDPATGLPARMMKLAAVVAPTGELASSLAQGIFVMEPSEGLRLLNDLPVVEGLLLGLDGSISMSDSLFVWMGR